MAIDVSALGTSLRIDATHPSLPGHFPGDPIVATRTIDEALAAETGAGLQLAVLADPDAAGLQRAVAALDEAGLPRWGVIARSDREHDDRSETVAPADWSARFVAQAFRSMLARHRLRRENAQLHDDLRSIGTRVAHDLRSPLGGVLTSADLLKEVLAEEAPASVPGLPGVGVAERSSGVRAPRLAPSLNSGGWWHER